MYLLKAIKWCLVISIILMCFQAVILPEAPAASATSPPTVTNSGDVEDWIIKKLMNDEIADLQLLFDEKHRILTAEFLVRLLTEPRVNGEGKPLKVRIANARVVEGLDLKGRTMRNETHLTNCSFDDFVNFMNARFQAIFSFEGSAFQNVNFESAIFKNVFIFRRVSISGYLNSSHGKFLDSKNGVFFERMRIAGHVLFSDAEFKGPVTFEHAEIGQFFRMDKAKFDLSANFNGIKIGTIATFKDAEFKGSPTFESMKVGGNTNFNGTKFNQNASFDNAEIGRNLFFKKSKFSNQNHLVSLEGMKVGGDADFESALFQGKTSFDNADIGRDIIFKDSRFTNGNQVVSFAGMKVKNRLLLENAIFYGGADFSRVDIAGDFQANQAEFAGSGRGRHATFKNMNVGGTVFLSKVQFKGVVSFQDADIKGWLNAFGITFGSQEEWPNLSGMKVGGGVSFYKAVFEGNANFTGTQCNFFDAAEAHFRHPSKKILFQRMRVYGSVNFHQTKFDGKVILDDINIDGDLNARGTQYSEESGALIRRVNIKGSASFDKAIFRCPVDFENSIIGRFFSAIETEFHDYTFFTGVKIGYHAEFDSSVFDGDYTKFDGARIGRDFSGVNLHFKKPDATVSFQGMIVGEAAIFEDATFAGTVNIKYADFRDLIIRNTQKVSSPIQEIDLTRALIRRELEIKNLSFIFMRAVSLKVEGPAYLQGLIIEEEADLTHSNFSTLTLEDICLPQSKDSLILDGVNYWSVEADNISALENGLCRKFEEETIVGKKVEESIKYDSSIYTDLEAFYKRKGDPKKADSVYIAQKDREMEEQHPVVIGLYYLWAVVAGYGRKPLNTLILSVVIIAFGCVVFRKKSGMVLTAGAGDTSSDETSSKDTSSEDTLSDNTYYKYNWLWYSIDLFMPFVDLHTANAWIPEPHRKFAPHWARLQRFLGLILVPIFIATLTGIIK